MATEIAPDLKLPNDQQAMQDSLAESANEARSATDIADDVAMGAITAREGLNLGAKAINFGSKLLKGKQLIGGAMLRSRIPYVGTALLADYATEAYRREIQGIDDGKGLFDLMGEDLGTRYANRAFSDEIERNSKPITQEELKAIYEGKNPLKPIVEMTPTGTSGLFGVPSMQRVVTGYEPMEDVSSPIPAPETAPVAPNVAPDVPVVAPEVTPEVTPEITPPTPNVTPRIEIAPQPDQLSDEEIAILRELRESKFASSPPVAPEGTETAPEGSEVASETPTPPKPPEESPAPAGTPEEQKTPEQSEYDLEIAEQEADLIENAKRKGYDQEQIDKMLGGVRERRAEAEDKEQLEKLLQILQLEKMMIGNALLKQKLGEPIVEEPSAGEISSYDRYLSGRGIKRDPNTNAFTVTEEGFFADSETPLDPLSALFQEMLGNEVGRYLLNLAPPELLQAKNAGELEEGVPYQVDDGRIFGFDGEDLRVIIDFGGLFNETLDDAIADPEEETEEE